MSALSVIVDPQDHSYTLFFEVDGLAEDENGNPAKAGAKVKVSLHPEAPMPQLEELEERARRLKQRGIPGIAKAADISLITWADFVAKGFNE